MEGSAWVIYLPFSDFATQWLMGEPGRIYIEWVTAPNFESVEEHFKQKSCTHYFINKENH